MSSFYGGGGGRSSGSGSGTKNYNELSNKPISNLILGGSTEMSATTFEDLEPGVYKAEGYFRYTDEYADVFNPVYVNGFIEVTTDSITGQPVVKFSNVENGDTILTTIIYLGNGEY